jgi:Flp pilus assembly secretin CpaC
MRPALIALLLASIALPAQAETITVALDEVQTMNFSAQVGTINVGNPAIADVTMVDDHHAFILGKSYGATNIIALNKKGEMIANTHVTVLNGQQATVTLQRGAERTTYSCTSNHCDVMPQPGDGKQADAVAGQISAHQSQAKQAATP